MTGVLFRYLISGYLKITFIVILIFFCFGLILNLFEEIEFFKNTETSILLPITLTALYVPSMIVKLSPFIIFISSMWFLLSLRNNRDLLILKVYGYSNFRVFFILASISFVLGWFILIAVNPITSSMTKYYEKTKSDHSLDIDHLVSINKNGLWIKEVTNKGHRIISADETNNNMLQNIIIYELNNDYKLLFKLTSSSADISKNKWRLKNTTVSDFRDGVVKSNFFKNYSIISKYDIEKIKSLYRNFDTMSFLDLVINYRELQNRGYNKNYLDQNLNTMLSIPFFLFIMTALSAILTLNALKRSNNLIFMITGLIACVAIYYFKDLSLALGQTNRISLSLAAWIPVAIIGLFCSIGILQINEK